MEKIGERARPSVAQTLVLAFLVLGHASRPNHAWSQCTFSMDCAGGQGSKTSESYPDQDSCDEGLRQAESKLAGMGGGCSVNACSCDGGGDGAASAGSGFSGYKREGFTSGQAATLMGAEALSNALGSAITNMLSGPSPAQRAHQEAAAAHQRQLELDRVRREDAAARARKRQFEKENKELLGEMKGGGLDTGDLQFKEAGAGSGRTEELGFKETRPVEPAPSGSEQLQKRTQQLLKEFLEPDPKRDAQTLSAVAAFNDTARVVDLKEGWIQKKTLTTTEPPLEVMTDTVLERLDRQSAERLRWLDDKIHRALEDAAGIEPVIGGGQTLKDRAKELGGKIIDEPISRTSAGGVYTAGKKLQAMAGGTVEELTNEETGLLPSAVSAGYESGTAAMQALSERGYGWSFNRMQVLHER